MAVLILEYALTPPSQTSLDQTYLNTGLKTQNVDELSLDILW